MTFKDLGVQILSLEISTNCNIRCTFCPIDLRAAPAQYMKLDQVKTVLDQLAEDGTLERVGFQFLNEPLLHPEVGAILAYAHQRGLRTYISTNGTVLNERIVDLLATTSPTHLKVSVQDVNPKTFNVVKGTKLSFEEFQRRVANLVRRRLTDARFQTAIEVDVAVPVRSHNQLVKKRGWLERLCGVTFTDQTINNADGQLLAHIRAFLAYLEREAQATIDWEHFNPDLYNTKTWTEDYVPTARLGPGITLELKAFYDWIGIDRKRPVTWASCPRMTHVVINYKGDFQLCCPDTHGKTAIGNVFQEPLKAIIAKPDNLAKLLRAPGYEIPTEHCRRCLGAPTRRGTLLLNLSNRFRHGLPKFIPEHRRDAAAALDRLRDRERAAGQPPVVAAIDASLHDVPAHEASPAGGR